MSNYLFFLSFFHKNKNTCNPKDELEKQDYDNNPIVQTIITKVKENNGVWNTTCKEAEEELFNNYSDLIDTTINQKRLDKIKNQLIKYDGIIYRIAQPKNGKRDLTFKKIVDFVENVDNNSTNSTISTKKEMYKNV